MTLSFLHIYFQKKCEQPSNAETQHSSNVDTVNQTRLRSNLPQNTEIEKMIKQRVEEGDGAGNRVIYKGMRGKKSTKGQEIR